jgi:predicted Fe-Mo cluster-binding NifX family protein
MILMTDGSNTKSKNGLRHEGSDQLAANTLSERLCREVNNAGIKLYSIAYEISDPVASNIVRGCASNSSMFFEARNASELSRAFKEIGDGINAVILTH